MQASQIAVS